MLSLTSQRKRRTSGPENFQSSAKTDFFNTIRQKRPQKSALVSEEARDTLVLEGRHQQIGAFCHAAETPLVPDAAFSAQCGSVQFGRMK
jgi:hypothetical protein